MALEENKNLATSLLRGPIIAAIKTFQLVKSFVSLIIFYLVIMELTLLIFGYSFNFNLLSRGQFECRRKVKNCLNTFIYYGINYNKDCSSQCMDTLFVTMDGYHEHNFFTRKLDEFYEGKIF